MYFRRSTGWVLLTAEKHRPSKRTSVEVRGARKYRFYPRLKDRAKLLSTTIAVSNIAIRETMSPNLT